MAQERFDIFDDDDLEDAQGSDLVKKLRAKLDEILKDNKEKDKELASLRSAERKRSIGSVLESKGYSPKIAAFIPSDLDPTEENLSDWLTEYGDVFGGPSEGQREQASGLAPEQIQAQRRMAAAEPANTQQFLSPDILSRIDEAQSEDEVLQILRGA